MNRTVASALALVLLGMQLSCTDSGTTPPPLLVPPEIVDIEPDSAAVGDTLRIIGAEFGSTQGTSTLRIGSVSFAEILSWNFTEIRAIVPTGAVTGNILVTVNGVPSNTYPFIIPNTVPITVSFATAIFPLFSTYGCAGCHNGNGSGQFWYDANATTTHNRLVDGNANVSGCATKLVVAGSSSQSVLYKRLEGTCETRMPQGGSAISSAHLSLFQQWIDEGASP